MKTIYVRSSCVMGLVLLVGLVLTGCGASNEDQEATSSQRTEEGWVSLYNGEDFTGWRFASEEAKKVWSIKDGVIDCDPQSEPRADKTLWSEKEFKDFQLRIDWG